MGSNLGAGIATMVLAIPLLIGAGVAGIGSALFGSSGAASSLICTPDGTPTGAVPGLTAEQVTNAATIVAVGKQMGVPEPGWVVAIAAALQESKLRNLHYGDRDSLGLFQQRPSMGWGTAQQITTPTYAATKFFERLTATPSWQTMSVNDAAQNVQGSGFPHAYAQHEDRARAIVATVGSGNSQAIPGNYAQFVSTCPQIGAGDCNNIQAAGSAAMVAINYACGQRGLPYVWGGNGAGDGGFDCSGLTKAAYAAAGITLPRTAQTQYEATARLIERQLLPGDLVFYGTPGNIHHVGLYVGGGQMIDAATFDVPVGYRPIRHPGDDFAGGGRITT
ncbi:C40 family peptidase [Amycolatopsis speibonae]|uniref:C40 family peptidase n=1 Tax=Amycolatopsis speibonae TaxID=1450224 RepID=A0ABV7P8T4_9PSEU